MAHAIIEYIAKHPGITSAEVFDGLGLKNIKSFKSTLNRLRPFLRTEEIPGTRALKYYAKYALQDDKAADQSNQEDDTRMAKRKQNTENNGTNFDVSISSWGITLFEGESRILLDDDRLEILEKYIEAYHTLHATLKDAGLIEEVDKQPDNLTHTEE